jgi:RIO kinase 1
VFALFPRANDDARLPAGPVAHPESGTKMNHLTDSLGPAEFDDSPDDPMSPCTSGGPGPFEPSFNGTRSEKQWIRQSLESFWRDRWFTDILYRVRPGKEATVYCCPAGPAIGVEYIAAKVYRPRKFRAMTNDWLYKQGRFTIGTDGKSAFDERTLKAVRQGTRYGKKVDMASWVAHEYNMLTELYELGADVPRPLAMGHNAILMEYLGDATRPAPILQSVELGEAEAVELLERLLWNVEAMLSVYRIHGDLSAYNVLYWQGDVWIIDLPQVVDALENPSAWSLLARDVDHLCSYFLRQGVEVNPAAITADLWERMAQGGLDLRRRRRIIC